MGVKGVEVKHLEVMTGQRNYVSLIKTYSHEKLRDKLHSGAGNYK